MNTPEEGLSAALSLANQGLKLIPVHRTNGNECSCRIKGCKSAGKHPRLKNWPSRATADAKIIESWFEKWPDTNIGVKLGEESDVVDVEFDDAEGEETAQRLLSGIKTPTFKSKRSTHRLFRFPAQLIEMKAVLKVDGLEIRLGAGNKGAQSVLPPSLHKSGIKYEWVQGLSPKDCCIAEFPQSLIRLLKESHESDRTHKRLNQSQRETLETHSGTKIGNRHTKLCELVGRDLYENGKTDELENRALTWAQRCVPPMDPDEVQKVVAALAEKQSSKSTSQSDERRKYLRNGSLSVTPYSEIESQMVDWLWQDRIPIGKLTLLAGEPGLGKTFLSMDLAARVSTGAAFPDNASCKVGEALILTCEDGAGDTLRPRLDKHGADVTKIGNINGITLISGETVYPNLRSHLDPIANYFEQHPNVRLLIIDPISAFLGDKTDSHNNSSVRAVLGPLVELAERFSVAILGITHLNKGEAKAINKVMGSIAFVAAARAVWQVSKDHEDDEKRLFLPVKNNLAQSTGLSFKIRDGRCEWSSEPVLRSVDDSFERNETPKEEAKAWLSAQLDQPIAAKVILRMAAGDGFSERTLKRAKKELGVVSYKEGDSWVWSMSNTRKSN
jgi:putative DNA primase/helicase